MKSKQILILLMIAGFVLTSFKPPKTFTLEANIYNLKNSKGNIVVMIYNKDGSIPDKTLSKYYLKKIVPIHNQKAKVVFNNLPAGYYAVSFFHDENANQKLDKTWMLPKEGVGLSNFKKVNLFHKPNFKDASFYIEKDTVIDIKTIYF